MNPAAYQPPIPFPEALKSSKPPNEANRLIESFKEANITIPLEEAIRYIPTFSKYVKELCTPQRRTNRIKLPESISSIILNKLLVKRKDPGPPLITCDIGGTQFSWSLLDSGASVNLIPKALYDKFKFVEMPPINVELQLADGSIKKPNGELTCRFRASLNHKDDGQTKFIKPNSQRQDIIIKYWVSIGSIHREQS